VFPGNLQSSYVEVEVDLASVDTGNESRDEHLRDPDFFEVETYPVAKVRAHSPELVGKDDRGRARYAAKFTIDLHGVEKTLDGEFSVLSESPITVEGSLVMDRLDFGIGGPRRFWNPVSITEEIPVSFRAALP
jgi:polyisoprenoid-binding protein YceI